MSKLFYPAIFHEEENGYSVVVPDIEGCFGEGDTIEEAYESAFDAVGLCLEDLAASNRDFPTPSDPKALNPQPGDFLVLIEFDSIKYRKKHDTRAVKKTLTIPSWLNEIATERNINFSSVLQNALMEQLGLK